MLWNHVWRTVREVVTERLMSNQPGQVVIRWLGAMFVGKEGDCDSVADGQPTWTGGNKMAWSYLWRTVREVVTVRLMSN